MENLKRTVEQLSARLVAIEHQTARTLSDSALLQCRRAVSLAHVGMRADIYVSEAEADLVCSYLQSRIKASFVYLHDITFTRGGYFKIPEQHGIQAAIQPVYVVHESLRLQDICIFVASVAEAEDMLWQRRKIGLMDIVVHALH